MCWVGPEYRRNEGFLRDPEGSYNGGKSPSSISCPLLGVTHITLCLASGKGTRAREESSPKGLREDRVQALLFRTKSRGRKVPTQWLRGLGRKGHSPHTARKKPLRLLPYPSVQALPLLLPQPLPSLTCTQELTQ